LIELPEREGENILDLLGPEVLQRSENRTVFRFRSRPLLTIPGGAVQGGIVASMLDMAMAFAAEPISTVTLHVDYLRPAMGPELTVTANVTRRGSRIVFIEAEMVDQEGRVIAKGRQTAVPLEP